MPGVAWIHSGRLLVVALLEPEPYLVEMSSFSSFTFERRDVLYTFIRRKESKVHVERHTGWTLESVPESGPRGSLNYGAFLPVFL